jgi:general nucleoside transport system ATP-binding protein
VTHSKTGERETVLRLSGITKRFGTLVANNNISLHLERGEILGLLGENGAGKTTLMNILFGHYVADAGSIEAFGHDLPPGEPKAALEAGIGMVHQHFTLAENLTVLDNIVLGTESLWRFRSASSKARQRILELSEEYGLKVNPDAVVSTLSVGEKQRIEILKALYREARILILDEPTAVLTPQESDALFETLKRFVAKGLSIIFISHKLNEILNACYRVSVLRGGKKVAEQFVEGATREELAELMVGRAVAKPKAEPMQQGRKILELKTARTQRGSLKLNNVDLAVHTHEIVGIAGVSGNGQSLLADVISGVQILSSGTMLLDDTSQIHSNPRKIVNQGIARIPEDRHAEGLVGDMSIMENLIAERLHSQEFSKRGIIDWKNAQAFADEIIRAYDVKCPGPSARAGLLSGGNMQKLILGRVMANAPKLVLANQPTRGLDVGAVAYVHEQLLAARARGAGVLLISEDLDELLAMSDRVAVMYQGRLSSPILRRQITIQNLGLMMAGQGFKHAA